jgi:signal transduction histidine kinase
MGIRYITEYIIVRDKKEDIFLSGISITFGLFTFLRTSNREYLFNIDSYTFTKIEVINMMIILIFTISFIKAFFELKQSKIFNVMIITNLIFAFAVLFAYKISIVFNIYNIWNLILVSHLTICSYLFFVSRKDWEKKESWAIAISFLVWIGAVGIDILYNFSILNLFNGYVSMYGFILFLIIIIIIKTSYYFTLKLEVKRLNRELSARVDEKTSELQNSKIELEIMNKKLLMMIEDLKGKEEQLIRSEKLAVIGEFAGSVTHEIKNPLGAILTNTQLLKLEIDEAVNENRNREKAEIEMIRLREMLESSEIIEVAVKQAKNIITNLLDYTRMEKDDRKRIDLNHVVNSAVMLVRKEFINLRINMSVDLGENLYFSGKSGEMTQVVLNLLLNARDALLEANNENKLIIVRTLMHDKKVVLEVEDNGIGMDEEHKAKVFEPFFTTKGKGKGTGLGMSVSYSILKKHNAEVEIISEKNVGTKFIIKMDIFT